MEQLSDLVLAIAGSPWVYVVLACAIAIDGFFPPVPSETILVALAAVAATGFGPPVWLLVVVAALASALGDTVAYMIGH